MSKKSEKEMREFHARQALRNKNTPSVDSIIASDSGFRPCLEEEDNSSDVLSYSWNNDRRC
jgi:hypothetical protein